jgi:hypothetical protein
VDELRRAPRRCHRLDLAGSTSLLWTSRVARLDVAGGSARVGATWALHLLGSAPCGRTAARRCVGHDVGRLDGAAVNELRHIAAARMWREASGSTSADST